MDARSTGKQIAARDARSGPQQRRPSSGGRLLVERTRAAATLPDPLLERAAQRLRTLGHPMRLRLIGLLIAGPRSVSDLAVALELRRDVVSKHLAELLAVHAVRRAQEGNFALYSLSDAITPQLVALACEAAQRDTLRLARLGSDALEGPKQRDGD